jgi:hypothetical protein
MSARKSRITTCLLAATLVATVGLFATGTALAADKPGWEVISRSYPTNLAPGSEGLLGVYVYNIGGAASEAGATVTDTLPAGIKGISSHGWACAGTVPDSCTREVFEIEGEHAVPGLASGKIQEFLLNVSVENGILPGIVTNTTTVTGGGAAASTTTSNQLTISSIEPNFGYTWVDGWASNADGSIDTQAGSHPFAYNFNFALNSKIKSTTSARDEPVPVQEVRNVVTNLPRGLVGNPTAVTQCSRELFDSEGCPTGSQIGIDKVFLGGVVAPSFFPNEELVRFHFPVYNLVPPPGHPAEFGFDLLGIQVFLDASVRSNGDYGITETVSHIPQHEIVANSVTIWGVPADAAHDPQRICVISRVIAGRLERENREGCPSPDGEVPFLTLSTSCTGAQVTSALAVPWGNENELVESTYASHDQQGVPVGLGGCYHLDFSPSLSVAPDTSYADTPTGPVVELRVPQEGLSKQEGLAAANIKDTKVVLPEGLVINPGQATGLGLCGPAEDGVGTQGPAKCPNDSIVGTDEIDSPLLSHSLQGNVYLLDSNPPDLKLLIAASGEGVNLKLIGHVSLDEATGRLTTTFDETPELPFTRFRLAFSGGARAALSTPTGCGTFSTSSDFASWSTPFISDAFSSSSFAIDHGPGGSACPGGELAFSPGMTAGATTDQADGFTNFSLLLTRGDDQQRIRGLRFTAPPGLTGKLAGVPLCTNSQAETNSCPAASQIGHTSVESGAGPYPLVIPEPGQRQAPIYLTEGYEGAPFGLSIVVPLRVGPFTLPTQRVRAKIEVDPETAQLTITTDPLPQVVAGVPTNVREVVATIDHPDFMINPTNCDPLSFSGTAFGAPPPGGTDAEASAPIRTHFQVGSCRALKFAPKLTVSVDAKTSRADGASLKVKLAFPNELKGEQANPRVVKVDLPKQLPSRLTTLQKACTEHQFDTNPAGCPSASIVGRASAITPILPVPLSGPAYFVSHGGAKFPELVMVLQGYGLTIVLRGETFINDKTSITSSTFRSVPDQPVSSFELDLPQGPNSALAANGNLCAGTLRMPTEFIAQNGAEVKQNTQLAVQGCPDALAIRSHRVQGHTLTLHVYVPAAGQLQVAGRGLRVQTKKYGARKTVTIKVEQKGTDGLKTKVSVTFTPDTGKARKRQVRTLSVMF